MVTVEFRSVGPGACLWCRREKETVYTVSFADKSFSGPLCKQDLLRAVEMKCPAEPEKKPVPAAQPVGNGITAK